MYEAKVKCARCAVEFVAYSPKAAYCPECRPLRQKETKRAYKKAHPSSSRPRTDKNRQYEAEYRQKHRERINANARESYRRRVANTKAKHIEQTPEERLNIQPIPTVTIEVAGVELTLYVCERMHLKARNLPCGDRYECWVKPHCHNIPKGKTPLAYGEQRSTYPSQQAKINGFMNRMEDE